MWLENKTSAAVIIKGKRFGRANYLETRVFFAASNVRQGQHTASLETIGSKAIGLLISGIVLSPSGIGGFEGFDCVKSLWYWRIRGKPTEDFEKFKI